MAKQNEKHKIYKELLELIENDKTNKPYSINKISEILAPKLNTSARTITGYIKEGAEGRLPPRGHKITLAELREKMRPAEDFS